MARTPTPATDSAPMHFGSRERTRLLLTLLGCTLLIAAFLTPWWTRGVAVNYDEQENPRGMTEAGEEGQFYNYGPFTLPGYDEGLTVDGARATATAVLGIGLLACALFVLALVTVRWLTATGRMETDYNTPIYLAMGAFIAGIFTILWAAFFLPLAGPGGGWLYGDEPDMADSGSLGGDPGFQPLETKRYANVGFFLGIVGAIGFPAYLWADASRTRALAGAAPARAPAQTPTF